MKMNETRRNAGITCPQCGSEVEGSNYTYMMECNRCLSKKEE
ncbi:hypothetical protein [Halobacillus naozhouensis]|uniref:YhfH-like protein n=1 Tax=Halobacillus naozhouensis TaxID=554880 RepID=A0ABY8J3J8_9BACI|nr:hypothetical protein [Halobacillus naozhouensis]WFT77085.1 hypothetical protein P9989_15075 [Halobacillus naozhouensis]